MIQAAAMKFCKFANHALLDIFHYRSLHTWPVEDLAHSLVKSCTCRVPGALMVPVHQFVSNCRWDNDTLVVGHQCTPKKGDKLIIGIVRARKACSLDFSIMGSAS